ncbi:hypothetical protein Q6D62_00065 [Corynebacterium diphtheriae]|uniref:hypothetical protein n=1 Tax=Corynebacterium diphtheriae TaxID=1717 RepID=UPI000B1C3D3F|nr:hypothetical protein [Corynebacterium diphtheriae]UEB38608.1 hypothetical protein LK425_09445 [Corynebacterium diphtheriae]WLF42800.1 hypothetical protein Q6D62_00065 [Corynebacterium diphtheriae]CAB0578095.1 hypothetical protein CIP107554_00044 [Corynebacterium diphtheriae]SUY72846.1 Uncharacterised protein [Corynebacterium diphtheriae bv. mitis]
MVGRIPMVALVAVMMKVAISTFDLQSVHPRTQLVIVDLSGADRGDSMVRALIVSTTSAVGFNLVGLGVARLGQHLRDLP